MKLRIDTSDQSVTRVTLYQDSMVIGEIVKEREKRSQVVLEAISELMRSKNLKLTDITELEVCQGPGSYTGLRVGVSVANTLQFLLGIPLNGDSCSVLPIYE